MCPSSFLCTFPGTVEIADSQEADVVVKPYKDWLSREKINHRHEERQWVDPCVPGLWFVVILYASFQALAAVRYRLRERHDKIFGICIQRPVENSGLKEMVHLFIVENWCMNHSFAVNSLLAAGLNNLFPCRLPYCWHCCSGLSWS